MSPKDAPQRDRSAWATLGVTLAPDPRPWVLCKGCIAP